VCGARLQPAAPPRLPVRPSASLRGLSDQKVRLFDGLFRCPFLKILREWTPQNLWTAEEEGKRRKGEEERGRKGGKGEGEGVMGGRQGHSCLTRRDDGPQERDADPCARFNSTWARGPAAQRACSQREAGPRSQRGAASAAQPRRQLARRSRAVGMRSAQQLRECAARAAARMHGQTAASLRRRTARAAQPRAGRLDGDTRRGRCVGRAFLCAALECVGARSLYSWERRSFDHRSHAFLCPPRSHR